MFIEALDGGIINTDYVVRIEKRVECARTAAAEEAARQKAKTAKAKEQAAAAQNTISVLADLFPACFAIFEQRRRPLKLKIHVDVLAALNGAATPKGIAVALRWYCGNVGYLRACTEGAERVGLDGKASGQVTREEADNARARLAQRRQSNGSRPHPIARAVSVDTTPTKPRLSLADLRKAAQARRQQSGA